MASREASLAMLHEVRAFRASLLPLFRYFPDETQEMFGWAVQRANTFEALAYLNCVNYEDLWKMQDISDLARRTVLRFNKRKAGKTASGARPVAVGDKI